MKEVESISKLVFILFQFPFQLPNSIKKERSPLLRMCAHREFFMLYGVEDVRIYGPVAEESTYSTIQRTLSQCVLFSLLI